MSTQQRREFFRVQPCLPVTCVVLGADGQARPGPPVVGVVENISAGGLLIATNAVLSVQDLLRVRVPMPPPSEGALEAEARVRRAEPIPHRSPPHLRVALQFVFAREADRDQWVRLVADLRAAFATAS
jgi:c-di-GMP-binding flagellar brake protein YcgR